MKLVQEHLQIENNTEINIEFDRMDQNDYMIHVYEIVENNGGTTTTATIGWFIVDSRTGEVQNDMGNKKSS